MTPIQRVRAFFAKKFEQQPDLLMRAPSSFNFIGKHADYNDRYVLPYDIGCSKIGARVIA